MEYAALQEKLETLLNSYTAYFDIDRDITVPGGFYPALAKYRLREENYIMSRANTVYATEQYEYAYFFLTEHLDADTLRRQIELSREAGLALIDPHKEHMFSYVTLVILAGTIEPEAKRLLARYRFRKNYRLALHGWMEYHIAAVDFSTEDVLSNPAGKDVRKILRQVFQSKAK